MYYFCMLNLLVQQVTNRVWKVNEVLTGELEQENGGMAPNNARTESAVIISGKLDTPTLWAVVYPGGLWRPWVTARKTEVELFK
jgi:hypothetical protein